MKGNSKCWPHRSGHVIDVVLAVLFLLLVIAGLVGLTIYLRRPQPSVTAWLRFEELINLAPAAAAAQKQNDLFRLVSRATIAEALKRPDVASISAIAQSDDPVAFVQSQMHVQARPGSELVLLNCYLPDRADAALLTNAIVEAFFHSENIDKYDAQLINSLEDKRTALGSEHRSLKQKVRQHPESLENKLALSRIEQDFKMLSAKIARLRGNAIRPPRFSLLRFAKADGS